MVVRDPRSPTPPATGVRVESGLKSSPDPLESAALQLHPLPGPADAAALRRHMDRCVALAVQAGLCRGRALAAHAAVQELWGEDLTRADRQLAGSLRALLGLAANPRQES